MNSVINIFRPDHWGVFERGGAGGGEFLQTLQLCGGGVQGLHVLPAEVPRLHGHVLHLHRIQRWTCQENQPIFLFFGVFFWHILVCGGFCWCYQRAGQMWLCFWGFSRGIVILKVIFFPLFSLQPRAPTCSRAVSLSPTGARGSQRCRPALMLPSSR